MATHRPLLSTAIVSALIQNPLHCYVTSTELHLLKKLRKLQFKLPQILRSLPLHGQNTNSGQGRRPYRHPTPPYGGVYCLPTPYLWMPSASALSGLRRFRARPILYCLQCPSTWLWLATRLYSTMLHPPLPFSVEIVALLLQRRQVFSIRSRNKIYR